MPAVTIRLVSETDADPLARLLRANRSFLSTTDPARPEEYFSGTGQRHDIADQRAAHEERRLLPYVVEADGELAGRVTLSQIFYKAFCSGILGYWIREDYNGRGIASAAVAQLIEVAFAAPWELHRIEAGTLVDNLGSQRVLQRNGFVRFGLAPRYLHINGAWRDHVLFQRLNEPPETAHEDRSKENACAS